MVSFINKNLFIEASKMNLVNKLKTGLKRTAFVVTALSALNFFSACPLPTPSINNPPTATLNVTPISGQAPLDTLIQLDGDDLDGKGDIIDYKIGEDKNNDGDIDDDNELIESGSSPIVDYPVTFYASGTKKIYGQVMDSQGAIGKDGPFLVDVYQLGNNPPEIISTPITEVNEGSAYSYDVEATDSDLEDILEYSLIQNPTWLEINSQTGLITGTVQKSPGDYPVEVKVSDGKDYDTQPYTLIVKNLIDISGRLEDNENDGIGRQGIIKAYNSLDNSFLKQAQVDSSGNFNFQLDEVVSEIILQARLGSSPTYDQSYIRTIRLDGAEDYSGLEVRAMPYDGPLLYDDGLIPGQITPIQFKTFMIDNNILHDTDYTFPGLTKWNFGELSDTISHPIFKGIQIVESYEGYIFSDPEGIKTILKESVYPKAGEINIQVVENIPNPSSGWGIIVLKPVVGGAGRTLTSDSFGMDGYIEQFYVEIDPYYELDERVIRHEVFGHGMNYPTPYHTDLDSIMNIFFTGTDFTAIDIKGSYIVSEPSYVGMENSDDILGLNWLND